MKPTAYHGISNHVVFGCGIVGSLILMSNHWPTYNLGTPELVGNLQIDDDC